jgi:hypothetical protein
MTPEPAIAVESTLGELPIATPGDVRAIHAADPAGANAGLSTTESAAAAGMHAAATTHAHPTATNMNPAATHAATMRLLRKGWACNCQRK